jgi:hypothetical protein
MSGALQGYVAARHPYARAADEVELALYSRHAQQLEAGGMDLQQQQQQPEQGARKQANIQAQAIEQQQQQQSEGSVLAEGQQRSRTLSKVKGSDAAADVVGGSQQEQVGDAMGGQQVEL